MTTNVIELSPSEISAAVRDCILSNIVPIVLGSPGAGKSEIMSQTIGDLKMREVTEIVSTMDQTDWRGVPDLDKKRKSTTWYAPDFLPRAEDPDTVVFLDEITQVPASCQAPLYQLLLNRRIGTVYTAPPATRFVAAGNLMDDGTFVNRIGSALRDRMIVLYIKQNIDDWSRWAYKAGIAPSVIAFLRFRPAMLFAFNKAEWASPTPRGWKMVSDIIQNAKSTGRVRDALIMGKVGEAGMREFTGFEALFNNAPSLDAIRMNPDTAEIPTRPEIRYAVANGLSLTATVGNMDRTVIYLNRMPEEYGMFAVKTATRRDSKLAATPSVTKWFVDHADALN